MISPLFLHCAVVEGTVEKNKGTSVLTSVFHPSGIFIFSVVIFARLLVGPTISCDIGWKKRGYFWPKVEGRVAFLERGFPLFPPAPPKRPHYHATSTS